jgi:hypothetical protein
MFWDALLDFNKWNIQNILKDASISFTIYFFLPKILLESFSMSKNNTIVLSNLLQLGIIQTGC